MLLRIEKRGGLGMVAVCVRKVFLILNLISFFLLSACGGGGGGGGDSSSSGSQSKPVIETGVFLDNAVEGMRYISGGQSGFTDKDGKFKYEHGKSVRFEVGGIIVGNCVGKAFVTPVDLVPGATDETNTTVINITKFLLAIDDDDDPQNGLKITE